MVEDGARLLALLTADRRWDPKPRDLFVVVPHLEIQAQPYVGSFRSLVEYTYVTDVSAALLAIALARRELGARSPPEAPAAVVEEARQYERASRYAGVDLLGVGGSNRGLVISGALYDEALGDRRRHGFAPDTALSVGASDVVWGWQDGHPEVVESRTRIFGFRTLRPAFDVLGPLLSHVGFELAIDLDTMRPPRDPEASWIRGELRAGVLVPVLASGDLADHLLVRLGASLMGFAIHEGPDTGGVGIPVGLEARFELGPVIANVDTTATPLIDPTHGDVHVVAAAICRLRVPIYDRLVLPWRGNVGISLEASARAAYSEVPGADGSFARVDAGVRIE